jgi:transposase-like protein
LKASILRRMASGAMTCNRCFAGHVVVEGESTP